MRRDLHTLQSSGMTLSEVGECDRAYLLRMLLF